MSKFKFLLITLVHLLSVLCSNIDSLDPYCNHPCSQIPNTMCEYPKGGPPTCSHFTKGLTQEQKDLVLKTHNELRKKLALGKDAKQASATNMMELTWDNEGAAIAQRWADQCQKSDQERPKDRCRTELNGEEGGQNMSVDLPDAPYPANELNSRLRGKIMDWYLPGDELNFQWHKEYIYSRYTESFSQMVWAQTTHLGCGFSYNDSMTSPMYRFVCNYYPSGNIEGELIYKKGLACTECPKGSGCSKRWPGLCTTVEDDMGGEIPSDAINTEASANMIDFSCFVILLNLILALSHH